jgi:hypothetical protein
MTNTRLSRIPYIKKAQPIMMGIKKGIGVIADKNNKWSTNYGNS